MDLSSRLQNALLQHQVRLKPVDPQQQPSTAMGYVSSILFDDNEDDEREMMDFLQGTRDKGYRDLLTELSSIISISQKNKVVTVHQENLPVSTPNIHSMLLECAQAVAANDITMVYSKVDSIQRSMPCKLVMNFVQALLARLTGSGLEAHRALEAKAVRRYSHLCTQIPTNRVTYQFAREMILDKCKGAKQVHIVDYGILRGHQWPSLIQAFSERVEGPPRLKITGIEFPHLESFDIGNKLMRYATFVGIHLVYRSIPSNSWEAENIPCCETSQEVLIVNCNLRMRHLKHDHGTSVSSHRNMLFRKIYSMRPSLFLLCDISASLSSPFFLQRFHEALRYYSACTEYFEAYVKDQVKPVMEEMLASKIMNVVACEGVDRYERASSYDNWESAVKNAGFEQVTLSDTVYSKVRNLLGQFEHSHNLGTAVDRNWLLVGWKDVLLYAMCGWQPALGDMSELQ